MTLINDEMCCETNESQGARGSKVAVAPLNVTCESSSLEEFYDGCHLVEIFQLEKTCN
jgi:hypothetical protein